MAAFGEYEPRNDNMLEAVWGEMTPHLSPTAELPEPVPVSSNFLAPYPPAVQGPAAPFAPNWPVPTIPQSMPWPSHADKASTWQPLMTVQPPGQVAAAYLAFQAGLWSPVPLAQPSNPGAGWGLIPSTFWGAQAGQSTGPPPHMRFHQAPGRPPSHCWPAQHRSQVALLIATIPHLP